MDWFEKARKERQGDYLTRWYEDEKSKRTSEEPAYIVMMAKEFYWAVLPYTNDGCLTMTQLGLDTKNAPFIRKKRTMRGVEYAIAFVSQNE